MENETPKEPSLTPYEVLSLQLLSNIAASLSSLLGKPVNPIPDLQNAYEKSQEQTIALIRQVNEVIEKLNVSARD